MYICTHISCRLHHRNAILGSAKVGLNRCLCYNNQCESRWVIDGGLDGSCYIFCWLCSAYSLPILLGSTESCWRSSKFSDGVIPNSNSYQPTFTRISCCSCRTWMTTGQRLDFLIGSTVHISPFPLRTSSPISISFLYFLPGLSTW